MARGSIQNRAFHDDDAAREALEAIRWPDGPFCPHCGNLDQEKIARGLGKAHRPGLYYCAACNGQFTVTVGTVMERSKVPLSKWLFAMHLMGASKKGMSALQLSRMLDLTYKTTWFLCHRIREAMTPAAREPIGGENKVVEADETYVGGKAKNRAFGRTPKKHIVLALVDREGHSYSMHIANVKATTLREAVTKVVDQRSHLMTDELLSYEGVGRQFAGHTTVNHSADEYVRLGGFAHINTAECRFSLMKRAVFGTHHSVSEAHLSRYLAEWDFKFNTRQMNDGERATLMAQGIEGKRLTYRPANGNNEARSIH